jgi:hypothetical protein
MGAPDGNSPQSAEFGENVALSAHGVRFVTLSSHLNARSKVGGSATGLAGSSPPRDTATIQRRLRVLGRGDR